LSSRCKQSVWTWTLHQKESAAFRPPILHIKVSIGGAGFSTSHPFHPCHRRRRLRRARACLP
jgi:hypothetical protein